MRPLSVAAWTAARGLRRLRDLRGSHPGCRFPRSWALAVTRLVVMATPSGIERKVRHLGNDVQSIYELLAAISSTLQRHGNRLNELGEDLQAHGVRLDGIDGRLEGLGGQMEEVLTLLRR